MPSKNPKVDGYISKEKKWQAELRKLRSIILETQLQEDFKWRSPCYTIDEKNVAILQSFKDYCALLFVKGALLKDPHKLLNRLGENAQSGRQLRFTDVEGVETEASQITAYLEEAIEVEKAGLKVELKKTSDYAVPAEFQIQLKKSAALKKAFEALTPGRQRGYLLYFAGAKQPKTREARVEKCMQLILNGKGLDD